MDPELVRIIVWIIVIGIVGILLYQIWQVVVGALVILGMATAVQIYLRAKRR